MPLNASGKNDDLESMFVHSPLQSFTIIVIHIFLSPITESALAYNNDILAASASKDMVCFTKAWH